jgi:hypothetical protein
MTKTVVTTRLFDALCGSVYVEHLTASAREAWRIVSRAARVGAAETWFRAGTSVAAETTIVWLPGRGLMVGARTL